MEKKYNLLYSYKTSLVTQLFSQKLSFKEVIWKKVELNKFVVEYNEKAGNKNYPVLSSTLSGIYFQSDYFNKDVTSSDTKDYKIVPKGYFTYRSMSDTGAFRFNIQTITDKGIISPAYPVFNTEHIDKYFLEEYLNNNIKIKKQILMLKEGGTRYALSFKKFKNMTIEVPSLNEQRKISNCLKDITIKINSIKRKIELNKEFKHSLLSKMFC